MTTTGLEPWQNGLQSETVVVVLEDSDDSEAREARRREKGKGKARATSVYSEGQGQPRNVVRTKSVARISSGKTPQVMVLSDSDSDGKDESDLDVGQDPDDERRVETVEHREGGEHVDEERSVRVMSIEVLPPSHAPLLKVAQRGRKTCGKPLLPPDIKPRLDEELSRLATRNTWGPVPERIDEFPEGEEFYVRSEVSSGSNGSGSESESEWEADGSDSDQDQDLAELTERRNLRYITMEDDRLKIKLGSAVVKTEVEEEEEEEISSCDDEEQIARLAQKRIDLRKIDHARIDGIHEFKRKQKALPARLRNIAGPDCDDDEFSWELHNRLNKPSVDTRIPQRSDTMIFQAMIDEIDGEEQPFAGRVRIVPPISGKPPYAPPFEFVWTNRLRYNDTIYPYQSPGCGCIGACSDEIGSSCECRIRQTAINLANGSAHVGFGYTAEGQIYADVFDKDIPIFECNSQCGCGIDCINRVVGRGRSVDVEIVYTGEKKGWGVRSASQTTIKRGQPLGIYAGEMIDFKEAAERGKIYDRAGRTYLFDIGFLSIGQNRLPKSHYPEMIISSGGSFEAINVVDAFGYGNFTRFLNHSCLPNVEIHSVHSDEAEHTRSLIVFCAGADINYGDEMFISYYGHDVNDPPLPRLFVETRSHAKQRKNPKLAEYRRKASQRRQRADHPCYCGSELCRGVMFRNE